MERVVKGQWGSATSQSRDVLVEQGHVAPGCTLNGDFAMVCVFARRSPCYGCQQDRTSCGVPVGTTFKSRTVMSDGVTPIGQSAMSAGQIPKQR